MSTVSKALDVLFCLAREPRDIGITELCGLCSLDKATVFRSLKALQSRGLVEQNPENRKYRLGLATISLAGQKLRRLSVVTTAQPYLAQLSQATHETVQLSARSGNQVLYLAVVESAQPIRVASDVGSLASLHCTAAGKVFLAFAEPDIDGLMLQLPLERHTDKTITDIDRLKANLEQVRRRGWSLDDEELSTHLRVVAAPIRDMNGQVLAALALGGPTMRITKDRIETMAEEVVATARSISMALAGQG